MTDIVERVARALCAEFGEDPDERHVVAGVCVGPIWHSYRMPAKVAINAMRKPTEAMTYAAWEYLDGQYYHNGIAEAVAAMIDAGLKESDAQAP